ncbi:transmembrane protein 150A-like isoform X2 [Silurus meridionalis]|uniref:CWH43-like N-terminal domain-containing protein n=1 Tax=Silurus meridionalis TaxID=175797 RepID=A0A8T0BJV0_SILME|nr:transmembrane protein 150A-like isoform X2 [Silurus meridionalis]KAF7705660.1 hypothetical protein HF521_020946 [Silurus meridionalis]
MSLWVLLPVTMSLCTISGAWIVYAMAVHNHHVCPITNCKCGVMPPESCWFSLLCSVGSFMMMLIGLLRYAQVMEQQKQNTMLNLMGLCSGWLCAAGLSLVGNFQVDFAKVLHYVGVFLAFPTSLLFVCVQTILTYRLAKTHTHSPTSHLRLTLSLLALITLLLCGAFFLQDSFTLQHWAAVCEWLFVVAVLLFYATFITDFRSVSSHTLVVLIHRGQRQGFSPNESKQERA